MKKIAIIFNRTVTGGGGCETSLENFIDFFNKDKYDITLYTYDENQELSKKIKDLVKVQYTRCGDFLSAILNDIFKFKFISATKKFYHRILLKKNNQNELLHQAKIYPLTSQSFDLAIAFKFNHEDTITTIYRINAKKKCTIMHSYPENTPYEIKFRTDCMKFFDKIYCVSETCLKSMKSLYPSFSNKLYLLRNTINSDEIIKKSVEFLPSEIKKNSVCTVGRISEEKGQTLIPKTVRMLVDSGYDIHWYLVGDGPSRETVEELSSEYDVLDRVIFLGTQPNPYPYIKSCDIYVQTSFTEGYCLTVAEAKILNKPIVTTNLPVMREHIISGENGIIVDGITSEDLYTGIKTLLDDPALCKKFTDNLSKQTWDNKDELQKIYDFIES